MMHIQSLLAIARSQGNLRKVRELTGLLQFFKNFNYHHREFLGIISDQILRSSKESIKEGISPDYIFHGNENQNGMPFVGLTQFTMEIRARKGIRRGDNFIIRETDRRILNSLRISIDERGDVVPKSARTDLIHYHSFGVKTGNLYIFGRKAKEAKIPSRPFIGLTERRKGILHKKLLAFLRRMRKNG